MTDDRPRDDDAGLATPAAPRGALGVIFLIVFIDLLGFGLIIPLLPFYALKYQATPLQVELLFSVFSICQFVAAPVLGMLSDRYGRRPVLVLSQIGSAAGYVLLGWATQHEWVNPATGLAVVYLSRVIDGLSGGNISTAQAYISDVTRAEDRARGMGMLGAAFGLGFAIGPGVGGVLGHFDASLPAYAAAGLSGLAAVMTAIRLKESHTRRKPAVEAWLHPRVFLPVLRRPVLTQLMLIWFLSMAAYVMMDASAALFLRDVFGYDQLHVGLYFTFVGVVIAIVQGGLIGRLTRAAGEWWLSTVGVALVAVGACGTLLTAYWPFLWLLLVGGVIAATGRSLQQPTISSLVSRHSDPKQQGTALGLFQGLGSLARAFGPFVGGLAYGHVGEIHPTRPYLLASAILMAAALWTWALHRVARRGAVAAQVAAEAA